MNYRLDTADIAGERVGFDHDGVITELAAGVVRFHRPGEDPVDRVSFAAAGGLRTLGLAAGAVVEIEAPVGWAGLGPAVRLLRERAAVEKWRLDLFRECGELVVEMPPAEGRPDEVVCDCTGITRGEIETLAPTCPDRIAIGAACRAGTVCGGCSTAIDEVLGRTTMAAAELVEIRRLDPLHALFRFRYVAGDAVAARPGSHVVLQAVIDGRWLSRSYTIVGFDDGFCDLIVKREPDGILSRWLHDHADTETSFRLSSPQGGDAVPVGALAVLAAGVGITPVLARLAAADADTIGIHWSVRWAEGSGLVAAVRSAAISAGCPISVRDTAVNGRQTGWGQLCPPDTADKVCVCGPDAFQHEVVAELLAAGWDASRIVIESFASPRRARTRLQHVDSFDYVQEPIVADSFHLVPTASVADEARAFLRQFYFEHGSPSAFQSRWAEVEDSIAVRGSYEHTYDELAFGARLAWRNSARCIGRFFWKSLQVKDMRHLETEEDVFAAIVAHLDEATNGGDLQPIITVFRPGAPDIRILNPQLILYAGYRNADGSITGDPKNADLTDLAIRLGWQGRGGRFDVLPVMIRIGERRPKLFELPAHVVLEVPLSHPIDPAFAELGLRWFAVPAVSGMALDVGGIQYGAAPSNGFYMNTEIGSVNLADPSRYDETRRVAVAMKRSTGSGNPLWRDQAVLDINVAVLHSFAKAGVRMLDHHALSAYFVKFREAEALAKRPSYGHWAWVMPPMGGNLSPIWRDNTLRKRILKPNYFYQPGPETIGDLRPA